MIARRDDRTTFGRHFVQDRGSLLPKPGFSLAVFFHHRISQFVLQRGVAANRRWTQPLSL